MKRLLVSLLVMGIVGCGDPVAELEGKGARFTNTERGEVVGADFLFTKITDEGLVHLKGLTTLQKLSLVDTQVTDAGLVHLKELTKLKRFTVWAPDVTGAGVADLQKALPDCEITH